MSRESSSTSLNDVKAAVSKWLELKDLTVVEVILAAVVANLLEGDSFWLLLIGPPNSAKTEILRSLAGFSKIH